MMPAVILAAGPREYRLADLDLPLGLERWLPQATSFEVELGFGKGKYLLRRAAAQSETGFLGVELVSSYFRRVVRSARRLGLENLTVARGEALFLLSAVLPRRFASAVHVYFPDPWPKGRHHKRRLMDPSTVDLVTGLLRPGGMLFFATDHQEYGERVGEVLGSDPSLRLRRLEEPWPGGPRTHYEAKYMREGRSILRLEARLDPALAAGNLHPLGRLGVVVGCRADGRATGRLRLSRTMAP